MIACTAQITHDQDYVPCTAKILSDMVYAILCEAVSVGLGDTWIAEEQYDPETDTTTYRPYSWEPVDGDLGVEVKCNGSDVSDYVHSMHITRTRDAVGICSLQVNDTGQFSRGDTVTVTMFRQDLGATGVLFKGYVEAREISPHDTGTIRCADGLRELRDSLFTESFSWLSESEDTIIMPVLQTGTVSELLHMVAGRTMGTNLGRTRVNREISFLNANRLSVLQGLAEEYGFTAYMDYGTDLLRLRTWGPIFALSGSHYDWVLDAGIDEEDSSETGVIVSYEKGSAEYPETEIREGFTDTYEWIDASEWTKAIPTDHRRLLVRRVAWKDTTLGGILVNREERVHERRYRDNRQWHEDLDFDSTMVLVRKVTYNRTVSPGYTVKEETITQERDVELYRVWWKEGPAETTYYITEFEVSGWETISKNTATIRGTTEGGVESKTTVTERKGEVVLTHEEQWDYNRRGGVDYYSHATYGDGTTVVRTETGVQPPGVPIPTGRWQVESLTEQAGSMENPRMATANYVSDRATAKSHAQRLYDVEVKGHSGYVVLPYIIPSLNPGDRMTTGATIFSGYTAGIEQVQTVIDFENLEVHQRLDVRLL